MSDATPTPAPAPAPAPAPTPAPTPSPAPAAPWHGITDPEGMAYVTNKGWQSPTDVIKSYQGAEKLIGRPADSLVPIPKPGDEAGWNAVYAKLGRPDDASKYDLKVGLPQGATPDEGFTKAMSDVFHKAGLNADQAKIIAEAYNKTAAGKSEQMTKDYELNVATDKKALLTKWGGGYERMMNAAQTATSALGFDAKMVDALESAMGYAGVMEFFAGLGQKLGDDKFISGAGKGFSGTMTPGEAQAEITKLKSDTTFQAILRDKQHPAHKESLKKWSDLFALGHPG